MSDAQSEVRDRLADAKRRLEATLGERQAAEGAIEETEAQLMRRREQLQALLKKEGELRAAIGELEKMRKAIDTAGALRPR